MLALVAAAAGVCAIVALGVSGSPWAAAVSVGFLALAVPFAAYLLLFGIVWVFSLLTQTIKPDPSDSSPFRAETPELAKAYGRHLPREALGLPGGAMRPWPEGLPPTHAVPGASPDGAAGAGVGGAAAPSADGQPAAVAEGTTVPFTPAPSSGASDKPGSH